MRAHHLNNDPEESEEEKLFAESRLFPIQVEINSNAFWLKTITRSRQREFFNFPSQIFARISTPDISGDVNYLLDENRLYLNLQRLCSLQKTLNQSNKIH